MSRARIAAAGLAGSSGDRLRTGTSAAPPRRAAQRTSPAWPGRAACAWAAIFALMSLYWAAGGLVGGETLGVEIDRLAHERGAAFVCGLWAAVAVKAVAAGLALALVESWGRRLPRRLLLVIGRVTGAAITLYAAVNFVQHTLMATEAIATPAALGTQALPWHLALWDPLWLVGGILFLAATRAFQVSPRAAEGG
jgi:uncharacterized protein DUF3995